MQIFFNFWDSPNDFPESLQFKLEAVADGRGRVLNLGFNIEGLTFEMISLVAGEA